MQKLEQAKNFKSAEAKNTNYDSSDTLKFEHHPQNQFKGHF